MFLASLPSPARATGPAWFLMLHVNTHQACRLPHQRICFTYFAAVRCLASTEHVNAAVTPKWAHYALYALSYAGLVSTPFATGVWLDGSRHFLACFAVGMAIVAASFFIFGMVI